MSIEEEEEEEEEEKENENRKRGGRKLKERNKMCVIFVNCSITKL